MTVRTLAGLLLLAILIIVPLTAIVAVRRRGMRDKRPFNPFR